MSICLIALMYLLAYDLKSKLVEEKSTYLYLYTGSDKCEIALYVSIRNSLAHGNIFKHGGYVYLYSMSSQNHNTDEFKRKISFLLRISNIESIDKMCSVFLKYLEA